MDTCLKINLWFLGAVKITPAHDHNDYGVGERHDLKFITMIDDSGSIRDVGDFHKEFQKQFVVSIIAAKKKAFTCGMVGWQAYTVSLTSLVFC